MDFHFDDEIVLRSRGCLYPIRIETNIHCNPDICGKFNNLTNVGLQGDGDVCQFYFKSVVEYENFIESLSKRAIMNNKVVCTI